MANCKNCGAEMPQGSLFCQSCGAQVSQEVSPPPQVVAQPEVPQQPYTQQAPPMQQATQVFTPPPVQAEPWAAPQQESQPAPPKPAQALPPETADTRQATQVFAAPPPRPEVPPVKAPDDKTKPAPAQAAYPIAPPRPSVQGGGAPAGSLAVEKSGGRLFVERFVGLIVGGVFLISAAVLVLPYLGTSNAFANLWYSAASMIPLAMAVALTWHACGPDLSVGYVALLPSAFAAATGDFVTGIIIGLAAALVVGFINGGLIYGLRLPSALVSLVVAFLVYFFIGMVTNMQTGGLDTLLGPDVVPYVLLIGAVLAVIVVACYNAFTKVGKPIEKRTDRDRRSITLLFAYPIAAVLAGIGGIMYTTRTMAFTAGVSFGFPQIALVWAVLACTRLCDNRIGTAIGALVAVIISACTSMGFTYMGLPVYAVQFLLILTALCLLVPAGLARWPFGKNSETRPLQQ